MPTRPNDDNYDEAEIARRRDEVVRRMANTPPQPKSKTPSIVPKGKRKLARVARLVRAVREP
jgi:hypothetical protein